MTPQVKLLPEHVIKDTATYKCLQSQFSVLYKEAQEMKSQTEDARALLQQTKKTHLRQIEQMEVNIYTELHFYDVYAPKTISALSILFGICSRQFVLIQLIY